MKGKRVLVTGSAGVIGRELLGMLRQEKYAVLSLDRKQLPGGDWSGVRHVRQDLALNSMAEIIRFKPQVIFHLAASFERSEETPGFWKMNWRDNILASHRLISLINEGRIKSLETFVFASSYLVYWPGLYMHQAPRGRVRRLKEEDRIGPRNLCGYSKYYIEGALDFIKKVAMPHLRIVNARIYRSYGCGSRDVISRWVRSALRGGRIDVYNKVNRYDYVFARDNAEGLLRLAKCNAAEGVVNLASGRPFSIKEVVSVLRARFPGLTVRDLVKVEPFEASAADVRRLNKLLGWTPAISVDSGVERIRCHELQRGE